MGQAFRHWGCRHGRGAAGRGLSMWRAHLQAMPRHLLHTAVACQAHMHGQPRQANSGSAHTYRKRPNRSQTGRQRRATVHSQLERFSTEQSHARPGREAWGAPCRRHPGTPRTEACTSHTLRGYQEWSAQGLQGANVRSDRGQLEAQPGGASAHGPPLPGGCAKDDPRMPVLEQRKGAATDAVTLRVDSAALWAAIRAGTCAAV